MASFFHLIIPYKRRFITVVIIGFFGTGANLVDPLISREEINLIKPLKLDPHDTDAINQRDLILKQIQLQ
ncbi:MAG TPA: hypothetical protein VJ184_00080 [Chryseolinea sp.]|nr:hypothetical protein [Chryseolinea sp.]